MTPRTKLVKTNFINGRTLFPEGLFFVLVLKESKQADFLIPPMELRISSMDF